MPNTPQVKLIAYTSNPEQTVSAAIHQCYSPASGAELTENISEEKRKKLIDIVCKGGHTSTLEHASFTFSIEGVSRALTHQLVRHRIASYSQQSQRYVKFKDGKFDYITPPAVNAQPELKAKYDEAVVQISKLYAELVEAGIKAEDARYLLPNAAETKIVVTMNARSLLNFFEHRLCMRAQWEIQIMARLMLAEVHKVAPEIFKYAGPSCETEKICWEGKMSCGKWKAITGGELRERQA